MTRFVISAEQCARICHEANRAYCQTLGDYTQPPWDEAPKWQRDSAIDGVLHALDGCPPEASHENWLLAKLADGWVYGPVKNPELREHPCMVPYDQLPEEQKRKDHLFVAIVNAFVEDRDG